MQVRVAGEGAGASAVLQLRRAVHRDPVAEDVLLGAMLERLEADCGMSEPYTLTPAEKGRDSAGAGPVPFC
jgi:hypothetical protein